MGNVQEIIHQTGEDRPKERDCHPHVIVSTDQDPLQGDPTHHHHLEKEIVMFIGQDQERHHCETSVEVHTMTTTGDAGRHHRDFLVQPLTQHRAALHLRCISIEIESVWPDHDLDLLPIHLVATLDTVVDHRDVIMTDHETLHLRHHLSNAKESENESDLNLLQRVLQQALRATVMGATTIEPHQLDRHDHMVHHCHKDLLLVALQPASLQCQHTIVLLVLVATPYQFRPDHEVPLQARLVLKDRLAIIQIHLFVVEAA